MSRLTWDETAEHVSRDQIFRRDWGQGNTSFPCSADHEQDWQPYPVDPQSCYMCHYTLYYLSSDNFVLAFKTLSTTCSVA